VRFKRAPGATPGSRMRRRVLARDRRTFDRATVQAYRSELESRALSSATINQKLSAIRKLASEAFYSKALDASTLQGIREVRGAKHQGIRTGNWLSKTDAEALLKAPEPTTLKGARDRAILAVMVGCGLRREEAARLSFEHVQQRDGRWCIIDLVGKHGRNRTVPMPAWAKAAIDDWAQAASINSGAIFRGVTKAGGRIVRESLTAQGILRCVQVYAKKIGAKVAPHDLRRTYAKLAHKGGAMLDQIQLSLGHASLMTTERYLGVKQDLHDAPCDYLHLDLGI
jgi:site-specific recombinase XerD